MGASGRSSTKQTARGASTASHRTSGNRARSTVVVEIRACTECQYGHGYWSSSDPHCAAAALSQALGCFSKSASSGWREKIPSRIPLGKTRTRWAPFLITFMGRHLAVRSQRRKWSNLPMSSLACPKQQQRQYRRQIYEPSREHGDVNNWLLRARSAEAAARNTNSRRE